VKKPILSFTFVFTIAVKHEPERRQTLLKRSTVYSLLLSNIVQYPLATFVALRLAASILEWSSHRNTGAYHQLKFLGGFSLVTDVCFTVILILASAMNET